MGQYPTSNAAAPHHAQVQFPPRTALLTAHGMELASLSAVLQTPRGHSSFPSKSAGARGRGQAATSASPRCRSRRRRVHLVAARRSLRVLRTPLPRWSDFAQEAPCRVQPRPRRDASSHPSNKLFLVLPAITSLRPPPLPQPPPAENFPTLEALVPKEQQGDCSAGVTARLCSRLKGNSPQGPRLVASPLDCGGKGEPDSSYLLLRMEVGKMDAELVTLGMKGKQEKVGRRE